MQHQSDTVWDTLGVILPCAAPCALSVCGFPASAVSAAVAMPLLTATVTNQAIQNPLISADQPQGLHGAAAAVRFAKAHLFSLIAGSSAPLVHSSMLGPGP